MIAPRLTREFCVALDLSKRSADASIAPMGAGEKQWRKFAILHIAAPPESPEAIAELTDWVDSLSGPGAMCRRVLVEATGNISKRFARALKATGRFPRAIIANPARAKYYLVSQGIRSKTDRLDAAGLALFAARCDFTQRAEPNEAQERLRALTRLRETYVEDRTAWKSRLSDLDNPAPGKHIKCTLRQTDRMIAELDREIQEQLACDPTLARQVKWLKRIKGIGVVTAVTITAEFGDLSRYSRSQLVAVAGLFPRQHESGQTVHRKPRLALGGGGHVRRTLYMAATSLFRSQGPLRDYIDRRCAQGANTMQTLGAVMRKLLLIARAVVKAGGEYHPELIGRANPANQRPTQAN